MRLRPVRCHLEGQLDRIAGADPGGVLQVGVDADPVAAAAVRLDDGVERVAVELLHSTGPRPLGASRGSSAGESTARGRTSG